MPSAQAAFPDRFTVDDTLPEDRASHYSYRPRNEDPPQGDGRLRAVATINERAIASLSGAVDPAHPAKDAVRVLHEPSLLLPSFWSKRTVTGGSRPT